MTGFWAEEGSVPRFIQNFAGLFVENAQIPNVKKTFKMMGITLGGLLLLFLLLMIPEPKKEVNLDIPESTFIWDRDAFWEQMEERFVKAREMEAANLDSVIKSERDTLENSILS